MFQHKVEPLKLDNLTKYCILTSFEGSDWIWRYAYDTHDAAVKVADELDKNKYNGDAETYIRFNFWYYSSAQYTYHYSKMTTQKYNWTISRREVR